MAYDADARMDPALEQRLDDLFSSWNRADSPGLVVGLSRGGKTLYRRGWGMASLETGVANTPRTRMRIGSTSKHFGCLLALLLAEDGKLDIDSPVRTYIPELTGRAGEPTLRQLMHHRGGVRCHLELAILKSGMAPPPLGAALSAMARQTGSNFAPGEAALYSNGGYHLLSIAIERAGGRPFEELLRTRLFEPLGMADTASVPDDYAIVPGGATLHMPTATGGWRRGIFPSEEIRAEGAIISTIDDMLRWTAHLRSHAVLGSSATWRTMMTPGVHIDGSTGLYPYACGLGLGEYRSLGVVHHSGGVFGGSCQMILVPEHQLDIVVIANGALGANPAKLAFDMIDLVLADHVAESARNIPTQGYESLLGDWWSEEAGMVYSLASQGDELRLELCKSPSGAPLERRPDGLAAAGDMTVDLDGALAAADGRLVVGFCGRKASFERVDEAAQDQRAGARLLVGRYRSHDADLTIDLAIEGEGLVVRALDAPAGLHAEVVMLGPNVAYTRPGPFAFGMNYVFQLLRDGEAVSGLRLQGARTRNLDFVRQQA